MLGIRLQFSTPNPDPEGLSATPYFVTNRETDRQMNQHAKS